MTQGLICSNCGNVSFKVHVEQEEGDETVIIKGFQCAIYDSYSEFKHSEEAEPVPAVPL